MSSSSSSSSSKGAYVDAAEDYLRATEEIKKILAMIKDLEAEKLTWMIAQGKAYDKMLKIEQKERNAVLDSLSKK